MADVPVTPTTLVSGVASASILDAGGTSIGNAGTGVWVITPVANTSLPSGERLLLKFLGVAASNTITIVAGARPPSQRAGLGSLTFALTTTQVKYIVVETARFLQANGTIRATAGAGDTTTCAAFILPKVH